MNKTNEIKQILDKFSLDSVYYLYKCEEVNNNHLACIYDIRINGNIRELKSALEKIDLSVDIVATDNFIYIFMN